MGHRKRILVFLLSTLVFMTGGTVVVVEEINKSFAELELLIEERALQVAAENNEAELIINDDNEEVAEIEEIEEVEDVKDSEDSSEILALNNPEKTVIKQEKQSEKVIVEKVSPKEKTISYKEIVDYENINFNKVYKNDASLAKGQSKVETAGSLGQREIITKVTLEDNVEVSRSVISNKVIKSPKDEVIINGTYEKPKEEVIKVTPNSTGSEKAMINEVNASRSENNLATLRDDNRLTAAAQIRVLEIVNSFSHTRPNGQRFNTVDAGWVNGENIAYGMADVSVTHGRFMASPGHRENILRSNFKSIGVASHRAENGVIYWVVLFGTK